MMHAPNGTDNYLKVMRAAGIATACDAPPAVVTLTPSKPARRADWLAWAAAAVLWAAYIAIVSFLVTG